MLNGSSFRVASFVGGALLLLIFLIPISAIVFIGTGADFQILVHVSKNLLDDYIRGSIVLLLLSLSVAMPIGVIGAWLIATCRFTGRNIFKWGLLLPLAIPSYICGYSLFGWFESTGEDLSLIRNYPLAGAGIIFGLCLYPYLYILCKNSFELVTKSYYENAVLLGRTPFVIFIKIYGWITIPAVVAGSALIGMEVLADFGLVSYFGLSTFTTGIFRVWNSFNDVGTATLLGIILVSCELYFLYIERRNRTKMKYYNVNRPGKPISFHLTGYKNIVAFLFCLFPILLGFVLPLMQLIEWAIESKNVWASTELIQLIFNSVILSSGSALCILIVGCLLVMVIKTSKNKAVTSLVHFFSLGYALPGIVIAISISAISSSLDKQFSTLFSYFSISYTAIFSGSLLMLGYCYMMRFTPIAFNSIESAVNLIKPSMYEQMDMQGKKKRDKINSVFLPILKGPLLFSFIFLFIEIIKELPATLVLRPYFFNTLSVKIYELISDERLSESAPFALCLVGLGLIFVYLMSKFDSERKYVS